MRCGTCGKRITGTAYFCHTCARDYGLIKWMNTPRETWPPWLRQFVRDCDSERRQEARMASVERLYREDSVDPEEAADEAYASGLDCVDAHLYIARRAKLQP